MATPEQLARQTIDALLTAAGWLLQDRDQFDRNAALGVAVREFPLPAGPCDYLLFVAGKAAGVIEAKKTGVTLSGVAEQSEKYMLRLPEHLARWDDLLVYDYESTGAETFFCNRRDPKPRSRRLFAFHRPETLHDWLRQPDTLRARLRQMPPLDPTPSQARRRREGIEQTAGTYSRKARVKVCSRPRTPAIAGGGESRSGTKIPRPSGRAGSNPASGTTIQELFLPTQKRPSHSCLWQRAGTTVRWG